MKKLPAHEERSVPKLVYDFTEGNRNQKDLLGGKGANLAEMTNLGLPVPPGFIISTEACRAYLKDGDVPASPAAEVPDILPPPEAAIDRRRPCQPGGGGHRASGPARGVYRPQAGRPVGPATG